MPILSCSWTLFFFSHRRCAPTCNLEQLSWTAALERPYYSRQMAQYTIKTRRQLQSSRTPQNWRSIYLCLHRWITCWLPTYKVVQIWPGLFTLVYIQISPGHIWNTLYINRSRLHVCDKWLVASWRHRVERGKLCSFENYWKFNINSLYSGVFKNAVVAYFWLLSETVGVAAKV